ncbi:jg2145 [Pararge aegeria aegeria]|uniref:Jg2145 protein n=1 Tax=Pararge aegeria aegeria TaxID=348720 RepID=A0A8S4RXU6_9NEOP|nr:jg2145 [Pararge aegeria aegeria]
MEILRKTIIVTDIAQRVAKLKWQWAGYIAWRIDGRLCPKVLKWRPRTGKRSVGSGGRRTLRVASVHRPNERWTDATRSEPLDPSEITPCYLELPIKDLYPVYTCKVSTVGCAFTKHIYLQETIK